MTREDALKEFIRLYGEAERGQVLINQIYVDFEEQMKAKDEEIKKLKAEKDSLCKTIKDLQTANTHWIIYHKENA